MGSFQTSDSHPGRWHKPVRVPKNKTDIFHAAREMVSDLEGWDVVSVDEGGLVLRCTKRNGLLGGTSDIEIRVEGPDGIPNSATHCTSTSSALLARDKGNVAEFVRKFFMRVT